MVKIMYLPTYLPLVQNNGVESSVMLDEFLGRLQNFRQSLNFVNPVVDVLKLFWGKSI